jgi:hypothetical protein
VEGDAGIRTPASIESPTHVLLDLRGELFENRRSDTRGIVKRS